MERSNSMRVFTHSYWLKIFITVAAFIVGACSLTYAKVIPKKPISTGKDYYIVFPKAAYGNQNVEAIINSPVKQRIHIMAAGNNGNGGYKNIPINKYQDIETGIFHIESTSEVTDIKGAARITTASPVSVIGQFGTSGTSGTYNALPITAWGTQYIVLDEPEGTNSGYPFYPGVFSCPQITIIASQPATTVEITLPQGERTAHGRTGSFSVTLNNAGDVYYFTNGADPAAVNRIENACVADFTGTHIVSQDPTKPIGVIVSQSHTSEPCGDNECGDFGMEWLPPICNWDTAYVITPSVPHGGNNPGQGEILRATFAYDSTTLYKTDSNGTVALGTFDHGYPLYIGNAITVPYVLSANHPFLVCEITTKPQSCLVGNRGGGANFTFSMCFLPGVDQWADFTPFGTADLAASSQVDLFFRMSDLKNLYWNGVPLQDSIGTPVKITGTPYAYAAIPIGTGTYYEIRGDSGATAGGAIYGYGESNFASNNGNGGDHTLNPEMTKSFAHPLGFNNYPFTSPDSFPPVITVDSISYCGSWRITVSDISGEQFNTGIYNITLAENSAPDSTYNVVYNSPLSYQIGAQSVTFNLD